MTGQSRRTSLPLLNYSCGRAETGRGVRSNCKATTVLRAPESVFLRLLTPRLAYQPFESLDLEGTSGLPVRCRACQPQRASSTFSVFAECCQEDGYGVSAFAELAAYFPGFPRRFRMTRGEHGSVALFAKSEGARHGRQSNKQKGSGIAASDDKFSRLPTTHCMIGSPRRMNVGHFPATFFKLWTGSLSDSALHACFSFT